MTGDQNDMAGRLRSVLPAGWFPPPAGDPIDIPGAPIGSFAIGISSVGDLIIEQPQTTPVLDGVLAGLGSCFAWLYSLIAYVNLQGRITTATGVFLDIIGLDFLGTRVVRKSGQSDASWRGRIQDEILAPRATRPAMISRLTKLTGRVPVIFEPTMPGDTGGYNVGGVGYGVAGGYGNLLLPFQCFVTAYRPTGGGIATVAGYGNPSTFNHGAGGYGVGAIEYADMSMILGAVTDDDINAAVAATAADATIPWLRISN